MLIDSMLVIYMKRQKIESLQCSLNTAVTNVSEFTFSFLVFLRLWHSKVFRWSRLFLECWFSHSCAYHVSSVCFRPVSTLLTFGYTHCWQKQLEKRNSPKRTQKNMCYSFIAIYLTQTILHWCPIYMASFCLQRIVPTKAVDDYSPCGLNQQNSTCRSKPVFSKIT